MDDMGWLGWNGGQSKEEGVGGADNHFTHPRRYLCLYFESLADKESQPSPALTPKMLLIFAHK